MDDDIAMWDMRADNGRFPVSPHLSEKKEMVTKMRSIYIYIGFLKLIGNVIRFYFGGFNKSHAHSLCYETPAQLHIHM